MDNSDMQNIFDVLYEGFELNETPKAVERYLTYCKGSCICLDIEENEYLPCYNGIVLSKKNPLSSFAAFCYEMDPSDTFAIRIKLREASALLDKCVENNTGTAADYLRDLKNIRNTIKDSIGNAGYRSYLDLILKSGTDRTRFVQELLQNADDCYYPKESVPAFSLQQKGNVIVTQYNENGFTRANIRSITAIGESTKNRLLTGDYRSIGEKGVGFKTVFGMASEVKIYSGEYNFALTDSEPTIPKLISGVNDPVEGTKMEITLKDRSAVQELSAKDIIRLCLCLRQLKNIDINGIKVSVEDTDTQRIITVGSRKTIYTKYIHTFEISDEKALEERSNGTRKVYSKQQITCYVPDRTSETEYPLYCGLPTKHKIRIPMVIDAPFELTTSREEIETGSTAWNNIVRKEMYNAIINVIHARKETDRANVLRFERVATRINGNKGYSYVNDLSDLSYLNEVDYLLMLRSSRIIPTFDKGTYVSISEKYACKYPEAVTILLRKLSSSDYGDTRPNAVVDLDTGSASKEQKERVNAVFKALNCDKAPFSISLRLLEKHAVDYISDSEFRENLYEFLQNTPEVFYDRVKDMRIIPVYGLTGETQYISWADDCIFVKKNANRSERTYWILNESILPKSMCEKMIGENINEMNAEWERIRYIDNLKSILNSDDKAAIFYFLINEFSSGRLQKNDSKGTLLANRELIPLINEHGEMTTAKLFVSDMPIGYFETDMLQSITVHESYREFANYIDSPNLKDIHYEDLDYHKELTGNDLEMLKESYLIYSD
ncbi:MAG: hypothetical protein Q4C42_12200, partial [Clostridia bacterium]|nr:hypothetical protein [Clostridia bacterium]